MDATGLVTLAKCVHTAHQVYSQEYPVTDYFAIEVGGGSRADHGLVTKIRPLRVGRYGYIRAREVRFNAVQSDDLTLDELTYPTQAGEERFLQFITPGREIAGFLRLALLDRSLPPLTPELAEAAIVREVHVYGQALGIGETAEGRAQHSGLGTTLLERAAEVARAAGYSRLAVISAVGTRAYYRKRGFSDAGLYQVRELLSTRVDLPRQS